ncbi:MAG: sensor histidine kinase [Desulfomonilaceae bacterium]
MKEQKPDIGIVFLCDLDGTVLEVIRDELGLTDRIHSGKSLSTIVERGSLGKSLNFIVEIKSKGAAFDWQLGVPILDLVEVLSFAGALWNERLLIVAAKTADGLEKLVNELTQMGNEQINNLRSAMKAHADLKKNQKQKESTLYDELGRLNNELANLQRELTKKNIELEKLNEEKNRFLGIAAHDLRNPLNAIQMYSEFLSDEASEVLTPEQIEFVSIIHSSSQFMLRLVNDLLDVAKIESGKLELDLTRTDLIDLIRHNVTLNNTMASTKNISIDFHYDQDIPETLVDTAKIEQVLNNLIVNAIKFSNQGSVINVKVARSGKEAVISVKDQGQGIPANEIDKLFKPFQRTSVRSTGGEDSTGLGLAIVRKIVMGHQGRVWVESEVGQGSTFYVALPLLTD